MTSKALAGIGGVIVLTGIIALAVTLLGGIFDLNIPVRSLLGPAAAITFGWLLMVPMIYSGINTPGFIAIAVVYVIIFVGLAILFRSQETAWILLFYGGLGALAYGAKKRSPPEYPGVSYPNYLSDGESWRDKVPVNVRNPFGNSRTQACAADTLFVVTAVLILGVSYFTLVGEDVAAGFFSAIAAIFSETVELPKALGFLQEIIDYFLENFQVEYYVYATASLFWLAGNQTVSERYIPPRLAAIIVAIFGVLVLLSGLAVIFFRFDGDFSMLFLGACISALGATVAFLGVKLAS